MRIIELPSKVQEFIEYCNLEFGLSIRIRNKNQPEGIYNIIRKLVGIFNPEFESKYVTVMFGDVWVPGGWFDESGRLSKNEMHVVEILMHEMVHEADRKRLGSFLFALAYLFPQCLGLLGFISILGGLHINFLWFAVFFLFLLPVPSPTRAWLEIRGYRINVAIAQMFNGRNYAEEFARKLYIKQFKGSKYYWMLPVVEERITSELVDLTKLEEEQKELINWFSKNFNIN